MVRPSGTQAHSSTSPGSMSEVGRASEVSPQASPARNAPSGRGVLTQAALAVSASSMRAENNGSVSR